VLNHLSTQDPALQALAREWACLQIVCGFTARLVHVPATDNGLADYLSRSVPHSLPESTGLLSPELFNQGPVPIPDKASWVWAMN
jgi:hypothetical protein